MAGFVCYSKLSEKEIRKTAKDAIVGIKKFFEEHPRRRVCHAELWYGKQVAIRRNSVDEEIQKVVEETLAEE